MKKLLAIILVLCSIVSFASADVDLDSMSFDELYALRKKLDAEIMSRPEWKEVTVPAGTWEIGVDIPAGTYSISINDRSTTIKVYEDKKMDDYDLLLAKDDSPIGKYTFKKGQVLINSIPLIFSPQMALGF